MGLKSIKEIWNDAASPWTEFVRSGKDITRDEMSNPSMFGLLGDIRGKRILDIACGEGYNSRIMANMGATVVGVDISEKLIGSAVELEIEGEGGRGKRVGIEYHVSDTADLAEFPDGSFDLVTCFMAIMDIQEYREAIGEAGRILKPGGRFIFNMPHPCFEVRTKNGSYIGGWEYPISGEGAGPDPEDTRARDDPFAPLFYKVDNYFDTGDAEVIPWKMERLERQFTTIAFHRTLTDYTDALLSAGLLISRIREPRPSQKGIEKLPVLKHCLRIPHSITIEAVKR